MKAANLTWKWMMGLPSGNWLCLTGTGETMIEGMAMGRDRDEAARELEGFNARRAALGLTQFKIV